NLLGCELADRVAAVAPVAGAIPLERCAPTRPVAVLLVHGRADRVVDPGLARAARDWWTRANGCGPPLDRDGCEQFTGCAADVVYCEGPQAHRWPEDATTRIWSFFLAHPRVDISTRPPEAVPCRVDETPPSTSVPCWPSPWHC